MPINLNEAFKEAKAQRRVLSKLIIWESGVSKSQFYRIISGQEAPSPETKSRIAKSLNIDETQFDHLHQESKSIHKTETVSSTRAETAAPYNKKFLYFIFPTLALLLFGGVIFIGLNLQHPNDINRSQDVTRSDDTTLFIKDVTIPDGTSIPVNTEFIKTWRVKNTGKVVWKNRYLKRITPASNQICASPAMVPIPETNPGETVDISVTFTTPHLPGSCRTDWKSSDKNGNLHFPELHGLFSIITVTE